MKERCANCGTDVSQGLAFCPNCGKAISVDHDAPRQAEAGKQGGTLRVIALKSNPSSRPPELPEERLSGRAIVVIVVGLALLALLVYFGLKACGATGETGGPGGGSGPSTTPSEGTSGTRGESGAATTPEPGRGAQAAHKESQISGDGEGDFLAERWRNGGRDDRSCGHKVRTKRFP